MVEKEEEELKKGESKTTVANDCERYDKPPPTTTRKLTKFGKSEFELMRKWCAASAARNHDDVDDDGDDEDEPVPKAKSNGDTTIDKDRTYDLDHTVESSQSVVTGGTTNVATVVKTMKLACGIQGLGRACQRLIDYGRCEYLRHDIFCDRDDIVVDLCHYTPPHVSPQNAILRAYKSTTSNQETGQKSIWSRCMKALY